MVEDAHIAVGRGCGSGCRSGVHRLDRTQAPRSGPGCPSCRTRPNRTRSPHHAGQRRRIHPAAQLAPQIDPNDDVSVVRMEFPRSAMLAVGLEVNPDQVSDTVEAEVKLGSDGLARAVRFME